MDLSFSTLMAGLIFGVAGVWLIKRGKADANIAIAVIGLVLMVFPFFISAPALLWRIGIGLCALAYKLR